MIQQRRNHLVVVESVDKKDGPSPDPSDTRTTISYNVSNGTMTHPAPHHQQQQQQQRRQSSSSSCSSSSSSSQQRLFRLLRMIGIIILIIFVIDRVLRPFQSIPLTMNPTAVLPIIQTRTTSLPFIDKDQSSTMDYLDHHFIQTKSHHHPHPSILLHSSHRNDHTTSSSMGRSVTDIPNDSKTNNNSQTSMISKWMMEPPVSYTQHDLTRIVRRTQTCWHVLIFDPSHTHNTTTTTTTTNNTNQKNHNYVVQLYVLMDTKKIKNKKIDLSSLMILDCINNWSSSLIMLLMDGWMTNLRRKHNLQQVSFNKAISTDKTAISFHFRNTTTWQVLLDPISDYVHIRCLEVLLGTTATTTIANNTAAATATAAAAWDAAMVGCTSKQKGYPPFLTIGSVPKSTTRVRRNTPELSFRKFLYQYPTRFYNDCLYQWRLHHYHNHQPSPPVLSSQQYPTNHKNTKSNEMRCKLRDVVQTLIKNDTSSVYKTLIPQVIWTGSSFPFLRERLEFRHLQSCHESLPFHRGKLTMSQVARMLMDQQDRLSPRCLAAAMSLQAQVDWLQQSNITKTTHVTTNAADRKSIGLSTTTTTTTTTTTIPWIKVKYSKRSPQNKELLDRGYDFFLGDYMSSSQMAEYKYQIDLGGYGGTSWLGTITKLAMPGLLFHHETPTKDWYYDDEIQPWVHYVPIHTNLSNLYDMFVWAESHPKQAQQIAEQGQHYARYHVSHDHFAKTFERLYVQQLGVILQAYQTVDHDYGNNLPSLSSSSTTTTTTRESLASILQEYEKSGLFTKLIATCSETNCF